MSFFELLLIAIGLSMDAFAIAVCAGLTMRKSIIRKSLIVGLYFGVFQAFMPVLGYLLATRFADKITAYDHWITFVLLCIIGGKMVVESSKKDGCLDRVCPPEACSDRECPTSKETSLAPAAMLPLAIATSIDALAVGVSFAFMRVNIAPSALLIGIITFTLSMAGTKVGNVFGTKLKSKAELAGGIILMLIGLKILLEHLGVL